MTGGTFAPAAVVVAGETASTTLTGTSAGARSLKANVAGTTFTLAIEVRNPTPILTSPVKITGAPRFATQRHCSGTWTASTGAAFAYAWRRDGVVLAGALASTYTPVAADIGHAVGCTETLTRTFQDTASGTSATVKILKRIPVLALLQSSATGVTLRCGTALRSCVVKRGALAYAKLQAHASHPKGVRAGFVIEAKVGRRWKARLPVTLTFGTKALAVPFRRLLPGTYRFRLVFKGSATDLPARSAYRYFKIR
jgi:hypothetical protein